jgi:hypothetical protein
MTPHAPLADFDAHRVTQPAPAVQLRLPPPAGFCECGLRLSVANTDGVCDACGDDKARLAKRKRGGAVFCKVCGGEYFMAGYCHTHYRIYHQAAYERRRQREAAA